MKNSYDLTTNQGLEKAVEFLKDSSVRNSTTFGIIDSPVIWVAKKVLGIFDPAKAIENQSKAVVDLINAGKGNGAKKMKIIMDEEEGLQLDAPIEGVKISTSAGSNGKTTVEVEYLS